MIIIPALIFWGGLILVIFQVPYPDSLTTASAFQIFAFFVPLLLAISLTLNLIAKNIFISCSVALGVVLLLVLKALDSINIITIIIVITAVGLLISYFRKVRRTNLTKLPKIPKLTNVRKHIRHPERLVKDL